MLYSKKILVKWNSHNKRSFVKLGYIFTKYGDLFEVDINNAPKYSRELIILKCDICGRLFERTIENYNTSKNKTLLLDVCPDCQQIKAKLCVFEKYGVNNIFEKSEYIKECNNKKHNGKHHTQEEDFKDKYLRGANNNSWKGGVSYLEDRRNNPNEAIWRKQVYERDNYTCQCCGDNKGHNLNAHHIKPYKLYKESRFDVENGITLCESCHKKFHKIYGKINIGKKEILEYISNQSVTTTRDECNGGESLNVGERLALPEVENNLYFNKDEEIV